MIFGVDGVLGLGMAVFLRSFFVWIFGAGKGLGSTVGVACWCGVMGIAYCR